MSLPWRYTSADEYMNGTIQRLQSNNPTYKHLNIGKYYLTKNKDDSLTSYHIQQILKAATGNQYINEITFCGICIGCDGDKENKENHSTTNEYYREDGQEAMEQLWELLLSRRQQQQQQGGSSSVSSSSSWKRITFSSCTGNGLQALSSSSRTQQQQEQQQEQVPFINAIRIKNCQLTIKDMIAIQNNMIYNTSLTHLEISECDLRTTTTTTTTNDNDKQKTIIYPLSYGIASSTSIQVLELSYCPLDEQTIQCLSTNGLRYNTSLQSILLPGCELEDTMIESLVHDGLMGHPALKHLKLFRNHCGPKGAHAISQLLSSNNLETLDLSYQQFERADKLDIQLLSVSLGKNTSLKSLILSFNKLNDDDATLLAMGLANNTSLEEIDLRANNIRDVGTVALANGVVRNSPTLKKFCMYGNPLGEVGAQSLLDAIRINTEIVIMNMDYNLSVYDKIQYYAYLNQVGRRLLKDENTNRAIWSTIIERAKTISQESRGVCTAADLIFPLVRDPALFTGFR